MLLGFQLSLVWAGIQLVRVVSATSKETCPMVRFKQSESENGDVFCATSPSPNAAISVNTKNDCFHKCAHSADTCAAGFNYKHVEKRCEMFATAPTTLQFQQDCEYHTMAGIATATIEKFHGSCAEVYKSGEHADGIYKVYVGGAQRLAEVYCDMTTEGGGWTVFQRRQDGSMDFYLNWADYRDGFGNLTGEFWLGNDNLHWLTSARRQRLRIDLADFDGNSRYAEYDNFVVGPASSKYNLTSIGTYTGNAGNALLKHLGQKFSTPDQDNDQLSAGKCTLRYKGAWWYKQCHDSNLNGEYLGGVTTLYMRGVIWQHWRGDYYSLKFTEMKFRPFYY